jgi:serine/threonine-protein kinase
LTSTCPKCARELASPDEACPACATPHAKGAPPEPGPERTAIRTGGGGLLDGKWRLEQLLGEGGMGAVYLAHDLALDRKVAIKLMAPNLLSDRELVERFEREARMTAGLEHANVVPIYAVGKVQGRPFIVMKKLEGNTLSVHIRERGRLGLTEVVALMAQLCAGLGFIHSRGFVHRDIKSANIFVGPDGHATLLDFGILRGPGISGQTRAGVVMGTPQYMSPEQALGAANVDHRADLYALGVVLFECLSGSLPFDGENDLSIVQKQAHTPAPDIRDHVRGVPDRVAGVVTRALAKRPTDRYPTAAALLDALQAAAALPIALTQSVDAQDSAGLGPEPGTTRGKRSRWVKVTALGTAATLAGVTVLTTLYPPAREAMRAALFASTARPAFPPAPEPSPAQVSTALPEPEVTLTVPPKEPVSAPVEAEPPTPTTVTTTRERPASKPSRPRVGYVNVVTMHRGEPFWATINVNGVRRGTSPTLLELPAGRHRLLVERAGFKTIRRQIKVDAGRSATVRIELVP